LQKVTVTNFKLIHGDESLASYGKQDFSDHYFCSFCGIHVFTKTNRGGEDAVVVNLRCLGGVDVNAMEPRIFDGATLL